MNCPSRSHTSIADYQRRGCRCPVARQAAMDARRRWYARNAERRGRTKLPPKVDGTGTRRRLQALSTAGWGLKELAPMLGVSTQRVLQLRTQDRVLTTVEERVRSVFTIIGNQVGPNGRAQGAARRRDWIPASWWGDGLDDPDVKPLSPWDRFLTDRPTPLLLDRDVLDDQADLAVDSILDAIEAADEAWFAARARRTAA